MSLTQIVNSTLGPKRVDGHLCKNCVQEFVGERFIKWDGTCSNGVLLLADSPWNTEIEKGYVLAGSSGQVLERAFRALGVSRKAFGLANGSIWCKPPHLGWSDHPEQYPDAALALAQCRPYLDEYIAQVKPRAIVTLGGAALRRMVGTNDVTSFQCYVLDSQYNIPVIPTYHPSYLCRPGNKKLFFSLLIALTKALEIANGKAPAQVQEELLLDPPLDVARAYLERGLVNGRFPILYVDIETPRALGGDDGIDQEDRKFDTTGELGASYQMLRVGLSHARNTAITLPWQPPYIDLIRWAISKADRLIQHAHNHYDSRRLKANSCEITGKWASSMWAWHFYQSDMDKALEYVAPFFSNRKPWKHLSGMSPSFYNATDVTAMADVWLGCEAALKAEGRWDAFERHCVKFDRLLKRVELVGVCVDSEGKDKLMAELDSEIKDEEQKFLATVPEAARKVTIKKSKPNKDVDKYVEVVIPVTKRKRIKGHKGCEECVSTKGKVDGKMHACYFESVTEAKTVWRREEFNAGSSLQVKELLRELGIRVPTKRNKEGDTVETTGKKQLQRLSKRNEQLRPILAIRSRRTLRQNYDWNIDHDGRIRTYYGFNPSTWRLSSWHNNLAVIPRRGELSHRVRRLIRAAPGNVLAECVAPESRILKADLTWARADAIQIGDELIGFTVGKAGKFVSSIVKSVRILRRPRIRVVTSRGDTVVASNHQFFGRFMSYNRKWMKAEDLMGRLNTGAFMPFIGFPWNVEEGRDAGYLAGFFDGEGWVSRTHCGVAQNSGPLLEKVVDMLRGRKFNPVFHKGVTTVGSNAFKYGKENKVENWCITTMFETMRFLGTIRPIRLMRRSREVWEGRQTWGKRQQPAKVLRLEKLDEGDVVAIETTSGTYISDGFFSHNCDSSGIEAVLVGYYAKSERYIKLAKAGVHGWLTAAHMGNPIPIDLPFDELERQCKATKKSNPKLYDVIKPIVHGGNFDESAWGIYEQNPDEFASPKEAEELRAFYFSTEPGKDVVKWQEETRQQAHSQRCLQNAYGVKHWFWSVFAFNQGKGIWEPDSGGDGKRCLAFLPQSTAACMNREYGLTLAEKYPSMIPFMRLFTYDSILLEYPESLGEDPLRTLAGVMSMKLPALDGLSIGVEAKTGYDLENMSEIKL